MKILKVVIDMGNTCCCEFGPPLIGASLVLVKVEDWCNPSTKIVYFNRHLLDAKFL